MQHKLFQKIVFCFAILFLIGASNLIVNAQGNVPINGSIGNGRLQRGKAATVTIVMDIPGGLHVNSNRPLSQYAIPTKIGVSGTGLKIGIVKYPRGATKKFSFSEEQISVYEGRTVFSFPITIPANFKGNVAKVRATVNYQSCTDEVCYRPRNEEITLSAVVK
jgi:hypothetical protein